MKLYDMIYSIQRLFSDNLNLRADWIEDGYEYPEERPFVTIEILSDERISRAKQNESVQVIEHLQIGYHATDAVDKTKKSEEIADYLTFNRVPYFNTEKSVVDPEGSFLCEVTTVVPMSASEVNRQAEYHRVYFDVEIENIKRRG